MVRTRVRAEGAICEGNGSGFGIDKDSSNSGFMPWAQSTGSITATVSLTAGQAAGVSTVSGTSAALTVSLPSAALTAGSMIVFRSLSAHAHIVSASGDAGNTITRQVFSGTAGMVSGLGSRVTFPATVGTSCVLFSDGLSYCLIGGSGTLTVT